MAKDHECGTSTGICGSLTFGTGILDDNGYWEFGCSQCARDYEKDHPGEIAWPFEKKPRVSKPTKLLVSLAPDLTDKQKAFALKTIRELIDNEGGEEALKILAAAAELMKPLLEARPSNN